MTISKENQGRWWRELRIESESGSCWNLGPLIVMAFRHGDEWQLGHQRADSDESEDWSVRALSKSPDDVPNLERFVVSGGDGGFKLSPKVADRSVVARPSMPLHVLSGESTKIYVSTPVWIEVTLGEPPRNVRELPIKRLSDTWFGPSTREGEVAYAQKTQARARLEEIPRRRYRTITPIVIRNNAKDDLLVDRMNLPLPFLSIFATPEGDLWTEAITLDREEGLAMAACGVEEGPPSEVAEAEEVSGPRVSVTESLFVRAFSSLFRPFHGED